MMFASHHHVHFHGNQLVHNTLKKTNMINHVVPIPVLQITNLLIKVVLFPYVFLEKKVFKLFPNNICFHFIINVFMLSLIHPHSHISNDFSMFNILIIIKHVRWFFFQSNGLV